MIHVMLLLIGEQPIPNLLPVLHLKSSRVILVHSDRTREQAKNLTDLLQVHNVQCSPCEVNAYDTSKAFEVMRTACADVPKGELIVNLTGATKLMSIAAYDLARERGAPFVYLESEKRKSSLHFHEPRDGRFVLTKAEEVDELIKLDDHFRAHGLEYSDGRFGTGEGEWFERAVAGALERAGLEVKHGIHFTRFGKQLEIDGAVRLKNQVGVIECKLTPNKRAIDQLSTAGGREFLGTYLVKFLVCAQQMNVEPADRHREQMRHLYELALARGIVPIELTSSAAPALSAQDNQKLVDAVWSALS